MNARTADIGQHPAQWECPCGKVAASRAGLATRLRAIAITLGALVAPAGAVISAASPHTAASAKADAAAIEPGWRGMLREYLRLEQAGLPALDAPEWAELSPALSPEMRRLGEAFARAAYPSDIRLGRRNFHALATNLGMATPSAADLRQFLHPNKLPWPGYSGPCDGNFHILLNTGTLNLDPADGSSKTHPVRDLARRHLGFFTTQDTVKKLVQTLSATLRAERASTKALCADEASRAVFLQKCDAAWRRRFPRKPRLGASEIAFLTALIRYVA
ncbi:MAG: hypothetical protein LBG65_06640 [Puniceicoccales bacterium]|jgi:hypothetical protein|nr:hypothetical protein [Puniceicoccales bacterium]